MMEQATRDDGVQPFHTIAWVDRDLRVPGDRRKVLVFGEISIFRGKGSRRAFLGWSRYNMAHDGSGMFDIEKVDRFDIRLRHVTHWAEITDPEGGLL